VAAALREVPGAPEPELVLIKTQGDRVQDVPLSELQGKSFFTKEIEEALLTDRVDVAVHSLKDLETTMPEGLTLGAVMEREDPRDALIASGPMEPDELPRGAKVGTSSLRRRAFLARWRPDLELADLRGNVPTRIEKLDRGEYDAIVLAVAGVKRLGLEERISACFPYTYFLPAVSQGAVGVQIRSDDPEVAGWVDFLNHEATRAATGAERAFLRRVEGGCQVPVGAYGQIQAGVLSLRAMVCSLDGASSVEGERSARPDEAGELGLGLAEEVLDRGGREILDAIGRGEDEG
jgi:hydroxymethylbilane synthase